MGLAGGLARGLGNSLAGGDLSGVDAEEGEHRDADRVCDEDSGGEGGGDGSDEHNE